MLKIVLDRLEGDNGRHAAVWNDGASALHHLPWFSGDLEEYPMFVSWVNDARFTAVIYCSESPASHLLKLVAALSSVRGCKTVIG
jgi:hypothetical protein